MNLQRLSSNSSLKWVIGFISLGDKNESIVEIHTNRYERQLKKTYFTAPYPKLITIDALKQRYGRILKANFSW